MERSKIMSEENMIWTPDCGISLHKYVKERLPISNYFIVERSNFFNDEEPIKHKVRLTATDDGKVCEMVKYSRNKCIILEENDTISVRLQKKQTQKNEKFKFNQRCSKLIAMLGQSGLWPEYKMRLECWQKLGYDIYQQHNIPHSIHSDNRFMWSQNPEEQEEFKKIYELNKYFTFQYLKELPPKHKEFFLNDLGMLPSDPKASSKFIFTHFGEKQSPIIC